MHKIFIIIVCCSFTAIGATAQRHQAFTHQDTLRGSVTPERAWWDVTHYDLSVKPDYKRKAIAGMNVITARATADGSVIQIDLQPPMAITSVMRNGRELARLREGNVYHVNLGEEITKGTMFQVAIRFEGSPHEAVHPPWDGGWIWKKDSNGAPWMTVACQGLGASVWYPCKDYQGDEPDSARLSVTVPDTLVAVGNGRLQETVHEPDHQLTYRWTVVSPISTYTIIPYIGKYVHWSKPFEGEKGTLDCDFWTLAENEERGRKQFTQVTAMLTCFEHWFGPYPFYADGYKLVEAPHLGMEHQSAIAYGNKFGNGYLGKDLSGTGWGLRWDYIIVHESGHEWFGNNITTNDIADMWVHEGFTSYSETLFTECHDGREAGNAYCVGTRSDIENAEPIIGKYGVNDEGSRDMYSKGANMIHTIRQLIDNDEKFRQILRGLNSRFYHQTVTTQQIEAYVSQQSGIDLSPVFDQYLRSTQVPVLQYFIRDKMLRYRWNHCNSAFNMALRIQAPNELWIHPTTEWQQMPIDTPDIHIDPNFYVGSRKM